MIDPFGLFLSPRTLPGMQLFEAPEYPIYELPKEIIPGVPWPAGFREDINKWSRSFIGTRCLVPKGTAYIIGGTMSVMRKEDIVKITNLGS